VIAHTPEVEQSASSSPRTEIVFALKMKISECLNGLGVPHTKHEIPIFLPVVEDCLNFRQVNLLCGTMLIDDAVEINLSYHTCFEICCTVKGEDLATPINLHTGYHGLSSSPYRVAMCVNISSCKVYPTILTVNGPGKGGSKDTSYLG
jgi:hypothetical protein